MEARRVIRIVLTVLAVAAAGTLFVTYGTTLPVTPFNSVEIDGPIAVDSNGKLTAVVDDESRRTLVLDFSGNLTGIISTTTLDSPFDAITDACVVDSSVYLSGVRFLPDSDIIAEERVAVYDTRGNFQGIVYEKKGEGDTIPSIKSLSNTPDGFAVAYEMHLGRDDDSSPSDDLAENVGADDSNETGHWVVFEVINENGEGEKHAISTNDVAVHDAAFSEGNREQYAVLSIRGVLDVNASTYDLQLFEGHVFTAIDIGDDGILYACDNETGGLYAISPEIADAHIQLVEGNGYDSVHENDGVISLCNTDSDKVMLYDLSGNVISEFCEVKLSTGLFAHTLLAWACSLYLAVMLLALLMRKLHRKVKEGDTEGIAPMLLAVAVVSAVAIAVGSLSYASYQRTLEARADVVNMCADYLEKSKDSLSADMEKADEDRNAIRRSEEQLDEVVDNLLHAAEPALLLVESAGNNNIGMYCTLYGKDKAGAFYLYDSAFEYVMGTSVQTSGNAHVEATFAEMHATDHELRTGRTLRDSILYRLVQIPATDGHNVAGVIEIGIKMRTLDSFAIGRIARTVLGLLVMMLVVYLTYSELRACARCMFSYRQSRKADDIGATAILTRPFTFAVTMLASIDAVLTVLIARDLLSKAGMGDSSPLLAVPAVMLGIGLVIGQGLYGLVSSRVGLRTLVLRGALAMLLCACLAGAAVAADSFWLFCAAKLALSVPFGLLTSLGYSLPRLARTKEASAYALGGVLRTDTSAAALGTVLGGYAAQALGNVGVYVLVALACFPIILMALNVFPKGMGPLEMMAQPERGRGRIRNLMKTPTALALALFIVLPTTVAAGYASFLFPLYSSDLGLSKADINNIVVLGQVVVFIGISSIEALEVRFGKWRVSMTSVAFLGLVFLLFSVKTTFAWSIAVIALVGLLCKSSYGWKAQWLKVAEYVGVPAGRATSAMFATRSFALIAQPFILSTLLGATESAAVIVIGMMCVACAALFFLTTRRSSLAADFAPGLSNDPAVAAKRP